MFSTVHLARHFVPSAAIIKPFRGRCMKHLLGQKVASRNSGRGRARLSSARRGNPTRAGALRTDAPYLPSLTYYVSFAFHRFNAQVAESYRAVVALQPERAGGLL